MKLLLERLGPLRRATLEIRPLTVLVGPNGTGTRLAAHALYGLLRALASRASWCGSEGSLLPSPDDAGLSAIAQRAAEQPMAMLAAAPEEASVEMSFDRPELLRGIPRRVRYSLSPGELGRIFRLPEGHLDEARVLLEVERSEFSPDRPAVLCLTLNKRLRTLSSVEQGLHGEAASSLKVVSGSWRDALRSRIGLFIRPVGGVLMLPAERLALASLHTLFRRGLHELVAAPVADFARFLEQAELLSKEGRGGLPAVAALLKDNVLCGRSTPGEAQKGGEFLAHHLSAPLHAASPLARALAGLDLYLRCVARPGDVLIIEEPELHADPVTQLTLTELLALLVHEGVTVILTTQSLHVVEHLDNLLGGGALPAAVQASAATLFKLGRSEAFLPRGGVAAYEFDSEGGVRPLIEHGGNAFAPDAAIGGVLDECTAVCSGLLNLQPKARRRAARRHRRERTARANDQGRL